MKSTIKNKTKQDDCKYIDREVVIRFLEERHPERKDFRHMSNDDLLMYAVAVIIAEEDARAIEELEEKYKDIKFPESLDRKFQELLDKYYPQEK